MEHQPDPTWDDLVAYASKELAPDRVHDIEQWIAATPEHQAQARRVEHIYASVGRRQIEPLDLAALRQAVDSQIRQAVAPDVATKIPARRFAFTKSWNSSARTGSRMAYGIGLVAALAIGLAAPKLTKVINNVRAPLTEREYSTQRAQQASFTLPDGTHVVLAPDTRLHFTGRHQGERIVKLEGQAYFTVTHDVNRPFTVQARGVDTRVLGTSFAVRSYPTDHMLQVAVAEGRVALSRGEESTVLLPGDVGRVTGNELPVVTRDAKIADVFGWMRGQLSFDDVPLRDVAVELERMYDLEVQIANAELGDRRVTVAFTGKSAEDMLSAIVPAIDAQYVRRGRTVVISSH